MDGLVPPELTRVTINLLPKVFCELSELMRRNGFNKTVAINRAITVYDLIDRSTRDGEQLVFRNRATGRERTVEII